MNKVLSTRFELNHIRHLSSSTSNLQVRQRELSRRGIQGQHQAQDLLRQHREQPHAQQAHHTAEKQRLAHPVLHSPGVPGPVGLGDQRGHHRWEEGDYPKRWWKHLCVLVNMVMYVCTNIYMWLNLYLYCMYVCMCVCVCVCMYV